MNIPTRAARALPSFAPDVSFPTIVERFGKPMPSHPRAVVAVPVRNEEERIIQCLAALCGQVEVDLSEVAVVLLLNNCTDGTLEQVRSIGDELPFALETHSVELPPGFANAGWARKLGMDAAANLASEDGVILTTDADTLVDEDWIEQSLKEIDSGLDAVAGYVMADPMELMELPQYILDRGRLEWEYQQLAAELQSRADPEPHDPWPRHNQNCGASVAVTVRAYRAIGGLPPIAVGEDRALFEKVRQIDGKIRHSLDVHVVTSARTDGRAPGGLSDSIRLRGDPDHHCDDALEVAISVLRRAAWRNQLKAIWEAGGIADSAESWAFKLRIPVESYRSAAKAAHFGLFWHELEALSHKLEWRLVTGAGLKRELRRMRRLVQAARARRQAGAKI
jgi:GT2 family glycosyltransferase